MAAAILKMRAAVTQLWNELGSHSPRSFQSKKTEATFRANSAKKAARKSRLQFLVVAAAVMPKSVLDLMELGLLRPVSMWEGSISVFEAVVDIALVSLSVWACICAVTKSAEKALSALSWHRLLALCMGAKALSGGMSSPRASLMIVTIGLSGLFIVPSFWQNLVSLLLVALLHCLAVALSGRPHDQDLPQYLKCTGVCLIPVIAWVHGNRRRRFLADAATSTFKLALAVNKRTLLGGHGGSTPAAVDPYFEEEELETLQEELKRETELMTERDACRTDAPRDRIFVSAKMLGRGAYGIVSVAFDTTTNEKMALKQCILGGGQSKTRGQDVLLSEIAKLRVLRHAHIVEYKASTLKNDSLSLLVEMCEGGSLKKVLQVGGALPEEQARACMAQLLSGVHYIHLLGLAHLDLKPENVLVKEGTLKISDFGSSKWVHSEARGTVRGSLPYLAPEVAKREGAGRKTDMWSMGAVMLELLTCDFLWEELNEENNTGRECTLDQVVRRLQTLTHVPEIPSASRLSPSALACVRACLAIRPADRPTAYKLQQHAFFTEAAAVAVLDAARFGAPGTDNDKDLRDSGEWWVVRWLSQFNEAFANPEMEREFIVAFSSPRICLLLPLLRLDAVIRTFFNLVWLGRDPSYKQAAMLAGMLPNIAIAFTPMSQETTVKCVRWGARAKRLLKFWLVWVHYKEPYFTNLWTVTLTMMIICQLSVQVLETVLLFCFFGVVLQLPHMVNDVQSAANWMEAEDKITLAALLVVSHVTCAAFSHNYLKSERRKFVRSYYRRLADDESGIQTRTDSETNANLKSTSLYS